MNLAAVMDQISARVDSIAGLRCFAYPPPTLSPPAAVVSYPDMLEFDKVYGRGMDRMRLPVVVVVGKVSDRGARNALAVYCNGTGAASVKQVLETGTYAAFDSVRVEGIEFDVVTIASVDYLGAAFTLDIVGNGA